MNQGLHPPKVRLNELLKAVTPLHTVNPADTDIQALTHDSSAVGAGSLYVAIRGNRFDGHDFIPQVLQRGAAGVVCEHLPKRAPQAPIIQVADSRRALSALADAFYGSPSNRLRVTGITGTNGKTSTTELLRAILNENGRGAGSIGTLGYCIDGHWVDSHLTTPDPVSLHATFHRMLGVGLTDACMEVSSHSLVQHRVSDVDFDVAVLTNITRDHLDAHGTMEAYARAKRRLFEQLSPDAVAVLPADNPYTESFAAATQAPVLTYGMDTLADVRGTLISAGVRGMEMVVRTPFESYRLSTHLLGRFNCMNILAAATAAFATGIGGEVVKEAIRGFSGVPGRLERISLPDRPDLPGVCVDFAHTPDALQKVLGALRPMVKGRLVCVVGCGGDRDRTKRPIMGRVAAEHADIAVLTADNSRSEHTENIIREMMAGIPAGREHVHVEPDRRRAIRRALELAGGPDSLVALCGRGCEKFLDLGYQKIAFDDRVVVRELMTKMPRKKRKTA